MGCASSGRTGGSRSGRRGACPPRARRPDGERRSGGRPVRRRSAPDGPGAPASTWRSRLPCRSARSRAPADRPRAARGRPCRPGTTGSAGGARRARAGRARGSAGRGRGSRSSRGRRRGAARVLSLSRKIGAMSDAQSYYEEYWSRPDPPPVGDPLAPRRLEIVLGLPAGGRGATRAGRRRRDRRPRRRACGRGARGGWDGALRHGRRACVRPPSRASVRPALDRGAAVAGGGRVVRRGRLLRGDRALAAAAQPVRGGAHRAQARRRACREHALPRARQGARGRRLPLRRALRGRGRPHPLLLRPGARAARGGDGIRGRDDPSPRPALAAVGEFAALGPPPPP